MRFIKMAAIGLAGATAMSGAASAQTYNAVNDFGNAVFSYGSGSPGAGFTSLTGYAADNCVGFAGLACYNTPGAPYTFPAIGKNISSSDPLTFATNVLPKDMLFLQTNPGTDAILRFVAPTTGAYRFSGQFERIDNSNNSGNGVTVGIASGAFLSSVALANSRAGAPGTYTYAFSNTFVLTAGQSVDFFQDSNGDVFFDGTGLRLDVSAVPEPATWGMMLAGFGLIGAGVRRRRNVATRAIA